MTPTALMTDLIHADLAILADGLRARGWRMATAESCTGGRIAGFCTELAGASDWFEGGVVSYSNAAKGALLGVPPALIERDGAVSEAVALAMAAGVLQRLPGAQLAVAVTGVAGPSGGSAAKPVGTVWLAWGWRVSDHAGADLIQTSARLQRFDGDRAAVRLATVSAALQGLIDCLEEGAEGRPAVALPDSTPGIA